MARIAKSLETFRKQINEAFPKRSKISDGWIGDEAHATRKSDHNPNAADVVQALDITHDPANGVDTWAMAETLRVRRDPRIKYVISNGRIFAFDKVPFEWRPYDGENKHAHHVHVSVKDDRASYDDASPWDLGKVPIATKPPEVRTPAPPDARRRMAKEIVGYEARRDKAGHLAIYVAPDGSKEVAGVNNTYHPAEYSKLAGALAAGQYETAERIAEDYVLSYTAPVTGWVTALGLEFYLRDCFFNRGPTGSARILQRALGVPDDGQIGQQTRAAISAADRNALLIELRKAREQYERDVMGRSPGHPQWAGLVNRWNKALDAAKKFAAEDGTPYKGREVAGTIAGAGAVIAGKELGDRFGWQGVAVVIVAALIVGFVIVKLWPKWRRRQ